MTNPYHLWLPLIAAFLLLGCSSSSRNPSAGCTAGDQLACSCEQGGSGIRVCDATGSYGTCDCSATQTPTLDAGNNTNLLTDADSGTGLLDAGIGPGDTVSDASTPPTQLLALYASCHADSDCESNFCFLYNDGAQLCTKTCIASSDCPAPSTGCNNKGVCKDPK